MIETRQLANGITLLMERIPHAISVSAGIWLLRGSRFEPVEWNGITHFVEHMFFKGTEKRSALEISREIEAVGGSLNAFTGKEVMCLYARVLHSHLDLALDLLADIFLQARFPGEEMEKERQVILQEIHMLEDSPEEWAHELFAASYWRGHALGRSTLGTREIIDRLSRDNLAAYAGTLRDPSRVWISVAGNLEADDVTQRADRLFSSLPAGALSPSVTELINPDSHQGLSVHLKDLEQVHLCFGTRGISYDHPKRYTFHVLNTLLGGGMSSRLFQEIREKRGLAYSVYSFQSSYLDTGLLGVYAGTARESVVEVLDLLMATLRDLKHAPVSGVELSVAKEQLKGNLLLSTESTSSRMSKMAMNAIYFGRQIDMQEVVVEIDRVQAQDVLELSRDLFRPEQMGLTILGDMDRECIPKLFLDC